MPFIYPITTAAPISLAGKTLIVPIVSTANVAQLAVDLLITTLELRRAAILDPTYCIPVVGGREDGTSEGISTPMELFGRPELEVVIMQQRSPVLVSRKQEFVDDLLKFIQESQFSGVLFLAGMDLSNRTDAQMMTPTYQIRLVPQQSQSSSAAAATLQNTPLQALEELPIPIYQSQSQSPTPIVSADDNKNDKAATSDDIPFIPGGGLTRRILSSISSSASSSAAAASSPTANSRRDQWTTPTACLLQFVMEGDNAADAAMLASATVRVLEVPVPGGQLRAPASWKAGLFGSPHDQSLYG